MINWKIYLSVRGFLFLLLFLGLTGEIRAQDRNMVAEFLCERAQGYYTKGEKQEALHEFSKVLLVDPGNPTAQEYLQKLGVPQGLYQPLKTASLHRRDKEGYGSSAILMEDRKSLDCQKSTLAMKDKAIFDLKDTLSRTLQQKKDSMAQGNKKVEAIEEKGSKDQDDLKQLIKARDEDIASLKEELALVKKSIFSVQKNARAKTPLPAAPDLSAGLTDLKSQIRNVQLELTEKEISLKEQDKTLMELKKQLEEITQRNDLSQKIIQEKDHQIKKLVEDLQELEEKLKQ